MLEVPLEYHRWRLDLFLAAKVHRLSRSRAAAICRQGKNVRLDPPRRIKPGTILYAGDRVTLLRPDESTGEAMPIEIAYADPWVMVIAKPSGVLVHPTARIFRDSLAWQLKAQAPPGEHREPVHRIDRETSGALMVSRQLEVVPVMRQRFAREGTREIDKLYVAVAHDPQGRWGLGDTAVLDTPLGNLPNTVTQVVMGRGDLPSRTDVTCLARRGEAALLACKLHTGRQHQIRVHLALEGTPVQGDKLYQNGEDFFIAWYDHPDDPELLAQLKAPRLLLHAARLGWRCPWSDAWREVHVPLPEDFGGDWGSTPWKKDEDEACS